MEGDKILNDSYKAIQKAIKENTTSSITINYNKFDDRTASTIRLALSRALRQRKDEVWADIQGVSKTK